MPAGPWVCSHVRDKQETLAQAAGAFPVAQEELDRGSLGNQELIITEAGVW